MELGYIKLFRKFTEWEWYDDNNTLKLFIHLLLTVNWKAKKWHGVTIKRGQILTSQSHLAQQTKLTRQQVRTSLEKLKSTNDITIQTTAKYTIITIKNYGKYQDNNQVDNQVITKSQPSSNQVVTTTKERKNVKKVKKYNTRKKIASHKHDFEKLERDLAKANKK